MKNIFLSIVAITIVFVTVSGFTKNHETSTKIKAINTIEQKSSNSFDFILNFDSIEDFNNFDINKIIDFENSCTVCVKIGIGSSGGEMCATAATCSEAVKMVKAGLKGIM